jgi:hypothetical protein
MVREVAITIFTIWRTAPTPFLARMMFVLLVAEVLQIRASAPRVVELENRAERADFRAY